MFSLFLERNLKRFPVDDLAVQRVDSKGSSRMVLHVHKPKSLALHGGVMDDGAHRGDLTEIFKQLEIIYNDWREVPAAGGEGAGEGHVNCNEIREQLIYELFKLKLSNDTLNLLSNEIFTS